MNVESKVRRSGIGVRGFGGDLTEEGEGLFTDIVGAIHGGEGQGGGPVSTSCDVVVALSICRAEIESGDKLL